MNHQCPLQLTIATVCRNAGTVLPRCIKSVLKLKEMDVTYEHLIIDGASTDGTVAFLQQELVEGRITRFISEPDEGLYDAMNKAINLAQGKIIVFINADDEICAEAVPACCAPILNSTAQYTIAKALLISDKGQKILVPRITQTLWRHPYCHQSMYCSTELLKQMGGFNGKKFKIGADTELMRRLYLAQIPYKIIPVVASRFYDGGISTSLNVINERLELMLHFAEHYRREITKKPHLLTPIIKHIRRNAARAINQDSNAETKNSVEQKLSLFINQVTHDISSTRKKLLSLYLHINKFTYFIQSKLTSNKRKQSLYTIQGEICQLLNKSMNYKNI